jgi:hypothetical protein
MNGEEVFDRPPKSGENREGLTRRRGDDDGDSGAHRVALTAQVTWMSRSLLVDLVGATPRPIRGKV